MVNDLSHKDCIGAIDGTHINEIVNEENQLRYRGRKGTTTPNVLTTCDFDYLFTYVLTGWEGSAHDSRIFHDTISNPSLNFPKPPPGNFVFQSNMLNLNIIHYYFIYHCRKILLSR